MPIKVDPSKICKCKRKEEPHVYLPEWCWEVIPPTKFKDVDDARQQYVLAVHTITRMNRDLSDVPGYSWRIRKEAEVYLESQGQPLDLLLSIALFLFDNSSVLSVTYRDNNQSVAVLHT